MSFADIVIDPEMSSYNTFRQQDIIYILPNAADLRLLVTAREKELQTINYVYASSSPPKIPLEHFVTLITKYLTTANISKAEKDTLSSYMHNIQHLDLEMLEGLAEFGNELKTALKDSAKYFNLEMLEGMLEGLEGLEAFGEELKTALGLTESGNKIVIDPDALQKIITLIIKTHIEVIKRMHRKNCLQDAKEKYRYKHTLQKSQRTRARRQAVQKILKAPSAV